MGEPHPRLALKPPPSVDASPSRWVWQSKFGAILIEVVGPDVFVNGQRVEPYAP